MNDSATAVTRLVAGFLPLAEPVAPLEELRCFNCGALLAMVHCAAPSVVSIKCGKSTCKRMNTLRVC